MVLLVQNVNKKKLTVERLYDDVYYIYILEIIELQILFENTEKHLRISFFIGKIIIICSFLSYYWSKCARICLSEMKLNFVNILPTYFITFFLINKTILCPIINYYLSFCSSVGLIITKKLRKAVLEHF